MHMQSQNPKPELSAMLSIQIHGATPQENRIQNVMGLMERASCLNSSLRVIKLDYTYRLIPNISEEKVKARKQLCSYAADVIKIMRDELIHEAFKIYAGGLTLDGSALYSEG